MATADTRIKLVLEDGSVFSGYAFGSERSVSGEVVFNTGMVGYPESMTDPSYRGQILTMTYPLIGNYGVPGNEREDGLLKYFESERIQVQGLVLANYADEYSHWNAKKSLSEWMKEFEIPGIAGVDTRALTMKLREQGTMLGKILPDENGDEGDGGGIDTTEDDGITIDETREEIGGKGEGTEFIDPNKRNLVAEVSIKENITYNGGEKKIVLVDCGVKNNIIRSFLNRNITVKRVPWDYDFLDEDANGILISNGPGDPKMCRKTIEHVRKALEENTTILGICLGSQILALAAGADTYKLKYGHRSQNQPCVEVGTKNKCYITSQNHGYAVDAETLPVDWREWFFNSNDGTNEGLMHISKPFFGAQFHPEAAPGPDDTDFIFDMFVRTLQ